jgi:hypothetical protein
MLKVQFIGLLLALGAVACGPAASTGSPAPDLQVQADLYAISQLEVVFHRASATKDIDLMMTVWADNATSTFGDQTYTGKDAIRNFYLTKAGSFKPENNWISETPAYKLRATVDGDTGTLYFECHFVDVDTRQIVAVVAQDTTVARINGRWVVTNADAATPVFEP